jgi:uncharacterized membrane protein
MTTSAPSSGRRGPFQHVVRWFFSGLLILTPAAVTLYVLYASFLWIDGLIDVEGRLGYAVPGLGFLITLVLVTLTGFLASNFFTRYLIGLAEKIFRRLPLARLIYNAIRDLLEAFVGEKKRFDQPVLVQVFPGSEARALGFVTRQDLDDIGLKDKVAVYFPQSYNFAGQLLVVPKESAKPVEADSTAMMTFIVSGGVSSQGDRGNTV